MNSAILSFNKKTEKLAKWLAKFFDVGDTLYFVEEDPMTWGDVSVGKENYLCISMGKAVLLYIKNEIDKFIIPSSDERINNSMYKKLRSFHVMDEDIFYAPVETMVLDNCNKSIIINYKKRKELDTIELHVTEHCNLNCHVCSMFCPLVDKKCFLCTGNMKRISYSLKNFLIMLRE